MPQRSINIQLPDRAGIDPQRLAETVVHAVRDVAVCLEEQKTRRQEIAAREAVALTELRDRRELFMTYLERSFDERRQTFDVLFQQVDRAMEAQDVGALQATLTALTALATSSPFRALTDLDATRAALRRGETWEF